MNDKEIVEGINFEKHFNRLMRIVIPGRALFLAIEIYVNIKALKKPS